MTRALVVTVTFDGAALAVHHLRPGQALTVGPPHEGRGPQPDYPLPGLAAPLAIARLSTEGVASCAFPGGCSDAGLRVGDEAFALDVLCAANLAVPVPGGHACTLQDGQELAFSLGALGFHVRLGEAPAARLPPPRLDLRAARYVAASLLAHGTLVLMALLAPPDPRALASQDLSNLPPRLMTVHITPPEAPPEPLTVPGAATTASGALHAPHRSPPPKVVAQSHLTGPGRGAAPTAAELRQTVRTVGALAVIANLKSSGPLARLFADESALAPGAAQALSDVHGLTGVEYAGPYGDGPGLVQAGPGGKCVGPNCDGTVRSGAMGTCGGRSTCDAMFGSSRRAVGPQLLARRSMTIIDPAPPTVSVKGGLPAELIRRVIRAHGNQFRFCYERALAQSRDGADDTRRGRVVVSFLIGGDGRVLSSVTREASLNNPAVQGCVNDAMRRLNFPQPEGGGLVQVSYPFLFQPAGE